MPMHVSAATSARAEQSAPAKIPAAATAAIEWEKLTLHPPFPFTPGREISRWTLAEQRGFGSVGVAAIRGCFSISCGIVIFASHAPARPLVSQPPGTYLLRSADRAAPPPRRGP